MAIHHWFADGTKISRCKYDQQKMDNKLIYQIKHEYLIQKWISFIFFASSANFSLCTLNRPSPPSLLTTYLGPPPSSQLIVPRPHPSFPGPTKLGRPCVPIASPPAHLFNFANGCHHMWCPLLTSLELPCLHCCFQITNWSLFCHHPVFCCI